MQFLPKVPIERPMTGEQPLPSALARGIQQLEPMPVTAQRLLALMNGLLVGWMRPYSTFDAISK